jgi:hypothetical protein
MPVATKPSPKKDAKSGRHPMARFKYGAWWPPLFDPVTKKAVCPMPDWKIEAKCFLNGNKKNLPGFLGAHKHFLNICRMFFSHEKAVRPLQINPNIERIIKEYCEHRFLSCAGHGGSGKTEALAIIAVVEFIIDPSNTAVLITSTTISDSRSRAWGRIEHHWNNACEYFGGEKNTPGHLVSSQAMIRYRLGDKKDDTRGIKLIPGKESEVTEGVGRMKGFHARRVRFLADELSDLSHKLVDAAKSNLFTNPDFRMVAAFNPSSYFDPAGVFSEPENGWGSVDLMSCDGWKTKLGYCIRFDGETSPNILLQRAGKPPIWEGLLLLASYDEAKKNNSATRFMEQYRGCWSDTGHEDSIYSNAEIISYLGMKKVDVWTTPPTLAAGFDPAFSHGGDRCAFVVVKCGRGICNSIELPCVEVQEAIYLDTNLDTSKDKKEQVVMLLKKAMKDRNIDPRNLAIDATGGGDVFATLMARDEFFGTQFLKVQFGGSASEMVFQGKKGCDKFVNMVSELWYAGKPMLRSGQIKGLLPDIMNEMTKRLYEEENGGKKRIKVEPKEVMVKRLNGKSPDLSDSFFLSLHVCRSRLGLRSGEVVQKAKPTMQSKSAVPGMFDWGKPKKPSVNEPDFYVPTGGGWADEGGGMGMFG